MEKTTSNDKQAMSDVAAHCAQEGVKGGNKRRKQHLQGTTTTSMTHRNDGHGWEAGGSGMRHILTIVHSGKCPARPPTDQFKRLIEEACPNHTYPVRHKLKDCGMMRSFMTSGSLTWGVELDEGMNGSDTTPFSEENTIMIVYGGCPPPSRRHHVSRLRPRAPTHCGWGHEVSGV
jgi:hypothetical protein